MRTTTLDILHEFIEKIVVHHREKVFGEMVQKVDIYYKMIGHIEIPRMTQREKESCIKLFGCTKKEQIA